MTLDILFDPTSYRWILNRHPRSNALYRLERQRVA